MTAETTEAREPGLMDAIERLQAAHTTYEAAAEAAVQRLTRELGLARAERDAANAELWHVAEALGELRGRSAHLDDAVSLVVQDREHLRGILQEMAAGRYCDRPDVAQSMLRRTE